MNEDKAEDLESVLRNLGFKKAEAVKRTEFVLGQHGDHVVSLEQLIKEALAWTQQSVQQVIEATQEAADPEIESINKKAAAAVVASSPPEAKSPSTSGSGWKGMFLFLMMVGAVMYFGVVKVLLALLGLLGVVVALILLIAAFGALLSKLGV